MHEASPSYEAPALKRFGTLRELTKSGPTGVLDSAAMSNDGCSAVGLGCTRDRSS